MVGLSNTMAETWKLVVAIACIFGGVGIILYSGGLPFQGLPPITIPNINQVWNPNAVHPQQSQPQSQYQEQPRIIIIRDP
jgi:hypothetical protein